MHLSKQKKNHVAREISYATAAQSRSGRALVRVVENATGRLQLIKRAIGYEHDVAAGRDFWDVITERYGLSLDVVGGSLDNIPTQGPCVVVSNHPYGILDGLMLGRILSKRRERYKILAHRVFRRAVDLEDVVLPISFDETREAMQENLQTRRNALKFLGEGGAVGVFPGGTVSTAPKPFGQAMDPFWRTFTAKMVSKSDACVVPVFFEGSNSRLFQLASHLHNTLRVALLINEFRARVDEPVRVVIGEPISREKLEPYLSDPQAMMDFLRAETYKLSPTPLSSIEYGYEFEKRFRNRSVG